MKDRIVKWIATALAVGFGLLLWAFVWRGPLGTYPSQMLVSPPQATVVPPTAPDGDTQFTAAWVDAYGPDSATDSTLTAAHAACLVLESEPDNPATPDMLVTAAMNNGLRLEEARFLVGSAMLLVCPDQGNRIPRGWVQ